MVVVVAVVAGDRVWEFSGVGAGHIVCGGLWLKGRDPDQAAKCEEF